MKTLLLAIVFFSVPVRAEEVPYVRVNGVDYFPSDLLRYRRITQLTTVQRLGSKRGVDRTRHVERLLNNEDMGFIGRLVMLQDAEKAQLAVTEEEILEVRNRMQEALRHFQVSIEELALDVGFAEEEFHRALREQTLAEKRLMEVIQPAIQISEEELRGIYEERLEELSMQESVRLQFVLCKIEDETDREQVKQARQKAERLRSMLVQEKRSFDSILGESDDPKSQDPNHPNLFYRGMGMIEQVYGKEVENRVFKMDAGEISEPLLGKDGYYLIYVFHKQSPNVPSFEAVKDQIRATKETELKIQESAKYRKSLREEAEVIYLSAGGTERG